MKPLKILTKGEIRKVAIQILTTERNCDVWPQNNVRAVRGRSFVGRKGISDILGISPVGLFVGCEIKTVSDRLSSDQIVWLMELKRRGGIALIATQDEYGKAILTEFKTD